MNTPWTGQITRSFICIYMAFRHARARSIENPILCELDGMNVYVCMGMGVYVCGNKVCEHELMDENLFNFVDFVLFSFFRSYLVGWCVFYASIW